MKTTSPDFESLKPGAELPELVRGPMSTAHIMRWSAATENWHRIHYDLPFATVRDALPGIVVNGSWKQHVLIQLLTGWVGDHGWVWKTSFRFAGIDVAGDTLRARGKVVSTSRCGEYGLAVVDVWLENDRGNVGTTGSATLVLPLGDGPPVPYPFDPVVLSGGENLR